MAYLSLFGSYTNSSYSYPGLILIADLFLFRSYTYSDLPKDIYLNFCQTDTYLP